MKRWTRVECTMSGRMGTVAVPNWIIHDTSILQVAWDDGTMTIRRVQSLIIWGDE